MLMLTACSSLYHKNTWKQRHLRYTDIPNNCNATIPIVVHWSAGWHASLVIPNRELKVSQYFKEFPFLEINWGDKGFYQAGADKLQQKLTAPKALFIPSQSVMYFVGIAENKSQWCQLYDSKIQFTDTDILLLKSSDNKSISRCLKIERDYGDLFQYYDAYQIWVTEDDFFALTKKINNSLHYTASGNPIDLGNGFLFDSAYSTVGRFFESDINYFGIIYTCNSWTAEVLGEIKAIKEIHNQHFLPQQQMFSHLRGTWEYYLFQEI